MHWIMMLCGLTMLVMLARTKAPFPKAEYTPLSRQELMNLLSETAKRAKEKGYTTLPVRRGLPHRLKSSLRQLKRISKEKASPAIRLLYENERMLLSEISDSVLKCRALPRLPRSQERIPRLCLLVLTVIRSDEPLAYDLLRESLAAWQKHQRMTEDELNALPAVLTLTLAERLCDWSKQSADFIPAHTIHSLLALRRIPWKTLLDENSVIHRMLLQDPVYQQMDEGSQADYRRRAAQIARTCRRTERTVCSIVLALCRSAESASVRSHCGFYLLDEGCAALLARLNALTPRRRILLFLSRHAFLLPRLISWTCFVVMLALGFFRGYAIVILIPFAAVLTLSLHAFLSGWYQRRFPSKCPRIALEHLPDDCPTLVICHAVLKNPSHAAEMVRKLSVMQKGNPDQQLHWMLLGDFQDSLTASMSTDAPIISAAAGAIETLNDDSGHPFFYFQRERSRAPGGKSYHGRERQHGAVETLLALLEGRSIHDSIAFSSVHPASLSGKYRYVITVDEEALLPPGSVLALMGAMLHPLQKKQPSRSGRVCSMLLPSFKNDAFRMETAFSRLLEESPDLIPDSAFRGTGLIDLHSFSNAVRDRIPGNVLLNANPLKAEIAGFAEDSGIHLLTHSPQTLAVYLHHRHTRFRTLWQMIPFLLPFIGLRSGLNPKARYQLWHSILQSLSAPLQMLVMLYAALTGREWLLAVITLVPMIALIFPLSPAACKRALTRLAILPCEAFACTDAILRTLYQLLLNRRQLTHIPFKPPRQQPSMLLFTLNMSFAGLFAGLPLLLNGAWFGLVPAAFWAAFPFLFPVLEQKKQLPQPSEPMREALLRLAMRTFSFFETVVTESAHGLPPVQVQIEPNKGLCHQASPDGIGLYLCSLLAACRLELITADEWIVRTAETVRSLEELTKWNGLFFSVYDTLMLQPEDSPIIPSEANGTLAVCLLTCAQGIRARLPELDAAYHDLPIRLERLCRTMQFEKLYDEEEDLFFTHRDPASSLPLKEHFDLLESESRLLSFAAIMLQKVPLRHWQRLERPRTASGALLSLHGSMAEYLFPVLFQPLAADTLLEHSARYALRMQRRRKLGSAFGISSCQFHVLDSEQRYRSSTFGIPQLALQTPDGTDVLSPCASLLCLPLAPKTVFQNLLRLQQLGLESPLGLFEAADFSPERTEGQSMLIVRSYTSHHQGMILCAVCNALCGDYVANLFSSLPEVQAYRILLDESPLP